MYKVIVETKGGRHIETFDVMPYMHEHPESIGLAVVEFIEKAELVCPLLTPPLEIRRVGPERE